MEKRIELERRGRKPNQITELILDNCRSTSIVGLTDEYTALESLSLINVGLTSLKGFPKLPNLKKLELSGNRISSGLNNLVSCPILQYLSLANNEIKDLETLQPLEELKHLIDLDLFKNKVTETKNFRQKIFALIPSLKYLDGFDSNEVDTLSEGDAVNGNESDPDLSTEEGDAEEDYDEDDDEEDDEDDDDDEDDEEGDDDESDDADAEKNGEDGDSDDDQDDDDDDEAAIEETHARGKKRKHE